MSTHRTSAARRRIALAALVTAVACIPAVAAAQGLPTLEATLGWETKIRFYGQINQAVLVHDDGGETNSYALVDNGNSSSRAGIRTEAPIGDGWVFRTNLEGEYKPNPSNRVSQKDSFVGNYDLDWTNLRKAEMIFANERYGTLWLGQGSMASDGIAEIDFSGTTVVAYSSISDVAGGQFFRRDDGALSGRAIGKVFTNFDGSRRLRARYDTPAWQGFSLSGAFGHEALVSDDRDYFDLAARWSGAAQDVKISAGAGYNWKGADETVSASASALHAPTGLNVTVAAGSDVTGDGDYLYGKLGLIRDFVSFGSTAVSLDAYLGADIGVDGGDSTSFGLALVQRVKAANLELYAVGRIHQFDDNVASYDDGVSFMSGLRFSF